MVATPYRFDPGHRHQYIACAPFYGGTRFTRSFYVEDLFSFRSRQSSIIYSIHNIFGLVAQLGERCVRNAEVEGSIPFKSTTGELPGAYTMALASSLSFSKQSVCFRSRKFFIFD